MNLRKPMQILIPVDFGQIYLLHDIIQYAHAFIVKYLFNSVLLEPSDEMIQKSTVHFDIPTYILQIVYRDTAPLWMIDFLTVKHIGRKNQQDRVCNRFLQQWLKMAFLDVNVIGKHIHKVLQCLLYL